MPVEKAVAQPPRAPYDVVFLDPPYSLEQADLAQVLGALADNDWLARGATMVVERSARGDEPAWPEGTPLTAARRTARPCSGTPPPTEPPLPTTHVTMARLDTGRATGHDG